MLGEIGIRNQASGKQKQLVFGRLRDRFDSLNLGLLAIDRNGLVEHKSFNPREVFQAAAVNDLHAVTVSVEIGFDDGNGDHQAQDRRRSHDQYR